jgi:hypothetical protein
MENAPLAVEDNDETEESPDKKLKSRDKRAEVIDLFAFRAKKAERERDEAASVEQPKPVEKSPESPAAESEPVSEAEAPTESLGETEVAVVRQEIIKAARAADAEQPHDPVTNPEEAAGDAAVEHFRDLVGDQGEEPAIALTETLSVMGLEADEIAELEPETDAETPLELIEEVAADLAVAESDKDDESAPHAAASSTAAVPVTPGGGVAVPPRGPVPPFGPMPGPSASGPGGPSNPNFNTNTAPATPNLAPAGERYYYGNPAGAALLGGIIGYLIGRRRGRIKTEKKLLPVQKKLEKQVEDLQWDLKAKETKIRHAAAEKVRVQGPAVIEKFPPVAALQPERSIDRKPEQTPENEPFHDSQPAPEHIGHMLVTANETAPATHAGRLAHEAARRPVKEPELPKENSLPIASGKRIETLNRAELLSMSEQIIVDGSSLRQIYESHLIGERGLRRLVAEHLHDGDLRKALRREVIEREIDFERDPAVRDMVPRQGLTGGGANDGRGKEALNKLLEKASVNINDNGEEAAFFKARALYEANQLQQHKQHRRLIDFGLAGVITVLIALIIVLYLSRM